MIKSLILLALFSLVFGEDVVTLTKDNFDEVVNNEPTIGVEFYAPWCGHCKKLAPNWEEAAGKLLKSDPPVKLAKVDCTTEESICQRFGVSGYPTIKIFKNGSPSEYKGPREAAGIVTAMNKAAAPAYKTLDNIDAAKKFVNYGGDVNIVGYFPTKNAEAEKFIQTANSMSDFRFGYISDENIATQLKINAPITMFRGGEKDQVVYSSGDLNEWIYDSSVEVPGEFTKDNAGRWLRKKLPVLKLFTDVNWGSNLKQTNYYLNRLKKIAEEYKGKILFALTDSADHADDLAKFGHTGNPTVAIGLDDHANSQRFRYDGEFSIQNVVSWLKDFVEGKLKAHIKSEPTPTPGPAGSVTVVTGNTFKDIVLDPSKDILFEMYAPWCGHCKNLAPIYDELAMSLKDNSNIVIAKMDATANDSPHGAYTASGYPTIYFAPAGGKETPVKYNGGRDVKSFTDYLKANAKNWSETSIKSEL